MLTASILAMAPSTRAAPADGLVAGFTTPPASARPRVWWHWMNGNITKDGIGKDLDWMSSIGIGGLQNFDAALATPQVVQKRLAYMTPEWTDAFGYAVKDAHQKGLEFGIAASPGWSETGGPWVKPMDGMKKIVWSTLSVEGSTPVIAKLPPIPRATGPYQDMPMQADINGPPPDPATTPHFGGDIAVYAYPTPAQALPTPQIHVGDQALDGTKLAGMAGPVNLPAGSDAAPTVISITYPTPQTVRSLSIFFPGAASMFTKASLAPELQAQDATGEWRTVAEVELTGVPSTVGFTPVTGANFRIVLKKKTLPSDTAFIPAPGVDVPPFMAAMFGPATTYSLGHLALSADPAVNQVEAKAGFATEDDYYSLDDRQNPNEAGVPSGSILDLTDKVSADGTLTWTPPPGHWTVVRLGYSLTGTQNHPSTPEATGLEVDKYDAPAVRRYLETYLANYTQKVGGDVLGRDGIRAMVTDSTEVGPSNWTPAFLDKFKALRGYDARSWLPALTGVVIDSRARTDAFLYDFRRTLADLVSSEHYATVAQVAHEHGMILYGEALESSRVTLGDDLTMRSHTDVPMSAMWSYQAPFGPTPVYFADMRGAASVAHIYGQNLAAAESLTSAFKPWAFAPGDLQPMIDLEFASGINRPVIHSSVHQPLDDDQKPGLSLMIFGQYFNRNETWAGMARPWIDYIARNSYLLQQGRNIADVGYFYGEEAPLIALYHNNLPADAPTKYAYDFVSADVLADQLSVDGGDLVAKGGARFRVLYLGGTSARMTLTTLRRLQALAEAGATIVGQAPVTSPSLADDPSTFQDLVKTLWSGQAITSVGKGRIVAGSDVEAALAAGGATPDFDYGADDKASPVLFVHRHTNDAEIYFVDSRSASARQVTARFRVTGKVPEIWHADTGKSEPVTYRIDAKTTEISLPFKARESYFVVFQKTAKSNAATVTAPAWTTLTPVTGQWRVTFEGLAAPAPQQMTRLSSLTTLTDPKTRYFSGTVVYRTRFDLPRGATLKKPLRLDLGKVGDVAEVVINGKPVGTAWKAPYTVAVGAAVHPGHNELEIRVADLWVNRLIGDAQPGAQKVTFTTLPTYNIDAPLRPSGLLGPVSLEMAR
jgi:hypothetical protein